MDVQYKKYQATLVEEIETIEKAFVEERNELIEAVYS
jgi:dynein regulatory complex protein 1